MKGFEYMTTNIKPVDIDKELTDAGLHGWELIAVLPMQKQSNVRQLGQQMPIMEIFLQLIFKKEICQE